jgi:alkanesulfonate monooxygenase SsuD/methylene tetrahydromethanopterin reductase-like flavin-dependent oxidoreductase (luciferase family)
VHGSPERCRARIRDYLDAGLTTPVLALVPGRDQLPVADLVRALAPS